MRKVKKWIMDGDKHEDSICFTLTIICHGNDKGHLFDKNRKKAWDTELFVGELSDVETLVGKPKIIAIQACRGCMYLCCRLRCTPLGRHPLDRQPPGQTTPPTDTPLGRHPPADTPRKTLPIRRPQHLSIYKARHAHRRLRKVLPLYSKIQALPGITSCRLMRDNNSRLI